MANSESSVPSALRAYIPPGLDFRGRRVVVTETELITEDQRLLLGELDCIWVEMVAAHNSDTQTQYTLLARTLKGPSIMLRKEVGHDMSVGMKRDLSAASMALAPIQEARRAAREKREPEPGRPAPIRLHPNEIAVAVSQMNPWQ